MKYFSISIFNRGLGDNIMAYSYYKSLSDYGKSTNTTSLIYVKSDLELEMVNIFNLENLCFKKIGYSPKLNMLNNIIPFFQKIFFLVDLIIFKKTTYLIFLDSSKSNIVNLINFFFRRSIIIGSSQNLNKSFNINLNLDENIHLSKKLLFFLPSEVKKNQKLFKIYNDSFLKKYLFDNYIVFAPGSGELEKHKRWPLEYYSKLADMFFNTKINIVIIGSKNEKKLVHNIIKLSKNKKIFSFISKNLIDSLSILNNAKLIIGGDSGNLHLAGIVNDNILALWGPTNKYKTSPLADNIDFIDQNLSCSPCYNRYRTGCGNNICMTNIMPNFVYNKILKILK